MSKGLFIGIDVGNSKTAYIAANDAGEVASFAMGPGASHHGHGPEGVAARLKEGVGSLNSGSAPRGVYIGAAGMDGDDDFRVLHQIYKQVFGSTPVKFDNDGLIALVNGAEGQPGMVVTCGTGNTNFAIDAEGRVARIGGLNPELGDVLGAWNIAAATASAAVRCEDGRDFPSLLPSLLRKNLGVDRLANLVCREFNNDMVRIAGDTLFEAARMGDGKAMEIVWNLTKEVLRITERFSHTHIGVGKPFRLILDGPVYKADYKPFLTMIRLAVESRFEAEIVVPDTPPVLGALYLAYTEAGVEITPELVSRVKESYAKRVSK